ncbi:hypothetical protein [Streptomyces sp. NPDC096033]|uniref:hypothetical protein n=1 Tax=Streptomyces sp. NPDC096033 TaxID=3366071 RepID=UPI0038164F67
MEATEARCQGCRQPRIVFTFSWVPNGWAEFVHAELCARCHSAATLKGEEGGLQYDAFGEVAA